MVKALPTIILLLLMSSQAMGTEIKGTPGELSEYLLVQRRIITLYGTAELKTEADKALVTLTIKTKEDHYKQALEANRTIRDKIRKKLIKAGINGKDIKFSRFSYTPGYGWFGDKPKSYEVKNDIKIAVLTEKQMQAVAGIVDTTKEAFLSNTKFEHTEKDKWKKKVLEKSLRDVTTKKAVYEKSLGLKLVPVRVVDQGIVELKQAPQRMSRARKAKVMFNSAAPSQIGESPDFSASGGFGETIYRANTAVEYIVRPRR